MPRKMIAHWPSAMIWMTNFSRGPEKEFPSLLLKDKSSFLIRFSQPESPGSIRIFVHDLNASLYKRIRLQKRRHCFWVALSEVTSRDGGSWCELDLILRREQAESCVDKLTIHHDPECLKGVPVAVWPLQHEDFVLVHTKA